jgi:hypothetical protein
LDIESVRFDGAMGRAYSFSIPFAIRIAVRIDNAP